MITVINFSYIKSTRGFLQQGIKNNQRPRGAVAGGNGTYFMAGESPQILLNCKENGILYSINIYNMVKENANRRVSEKLARTICEPLVGKEFNDWLSLRNKIINSLN